ncbi:MAG: hypothetical protein DRP63_05270 [Planctomycetota bacterium]|nr:MAG: hypothetical protein DRP63_05270 [Planctomycetota bacterium]
MVVVRTLTDAKEAVRRSGLPPLVVRLQDKRLINGAVWIGDLLREAGVKFVDVFERCAHMLAEDIKDGSDYQQYLAEIGCYDLPLRLPADVLARYGPFCVLAPQWLRWDRNAAKSAGCVVVEVSPSEQFAGEVRCCCAANLADQTRQVERLALPAALTTANTNSFLFLAMGTRDFPRSRVVRIDGQQKYASLLRRFGLEERWRQWALLVETQQVVDWSATQPFVCPAEDAPLLPFSEVVVCGLVEGEGKGDFSIRVGGLLAQERLHLLRYSEHRGKPVFADVAYEWRCGDERTAVERASEPMAWLQRTRVRLKIPYLSPSALETYLECPRKFLFRRLGVPEPESAGMLLGSTIHRILELHHKGKLRNAKRAAEAFLADKDITPLERTLIIQDAVALYHRYLASGLAEEACVYDCERRFELTLDGVPFVCKVDRIDRTQQGFVIVDYKRRGDKKETALLNLFSGDWQEGVKKDYQVPLYVEALRREGLRPVAGFLYIFLDFKNSGRVECVFLPWHKIEERLEGALMSAAELARHILEDEHFEPPPAPPCTTRRWCPFRHLCGR